MQKVQEDQQRMRQRHITAICEECGPDEPGTRPLNILIVGKPGCGKSSFIDSVAAALSEDRWVEYAIVGSREQARQVTNFIVQYRKCCSSLRSHYGRIQLPTLIDTPGLLDTDGNEQMQNFLRLLMYGHIRNQEFAHLMYQDCQMDWDDLLVRYSRAYDDMKVDRVIFVASAVDDNLPHRLMDCVMKAARPRHGFRRQIPVFGVMTKMDRVNEENRKQFEAKKKEFKSALGLHEGRLLCCSNYCDDTDPDKVKQDRLIPDLDLPILKFFRGVSRGDFSILFPCDYKETVNGYFKVLYGLYLLVQVCDRRLLIINQDDVLRVSFVRRLQDLWQRYRPDPLLFVRHLGGAFSVFAVNYLLYYLLFAPDPCGTVKRHKDAYYDLCVATLHDRLYVAEILALAAFLALFSCLLF